MGQYGLYGLLFSYDINCQLKAAVTASQYLLFVSLRRYYITSVFCEVEEKNSDYDMIVSYEFLCFLQSFRQVTCLLA